jgi:hypothetical protein
MRLKVVPIALAMSLLVCPGLALARSGSHSSYSGFSGTGSNSSSHSVTGYTTRQGTYVAPHHATDPNGTQRDNYGTRGNANPYTGSVGTRTPHY